MKDAIAVDPGKSGGVAWWHEDGLNAVPMPETDGDVVELVRRLKIQVPRHTVHIEEVGGYIGGASPGSAMFKFGFGCGVLRGAFMALGFRVELVRPQKWQKPLGLGTAKDAGGKAQWKRKLKAEAQRRFPGVEVTLATADALLILDWAASARSYTKERKV